MSKLQFMLLNNSVNVVLTGDVDESVHVPAKENGLPNPKFQKVRELILTDKMDELKELLFGDKFLVEDKYKKWNFVVENGIVLINGEALPNSLSDKLKSMAEQDLDCQPLLNFWNKLKENPSYHSIQHAYTFLEHNNFTIHEDGDLIGYKAVTGEFKDKRTQTFDNRVGSRPSVPRNSVDDDYRNACSYGLHVSSHSFAEGFKDSIGDVVVVVKVNPKDIVAVTHDEQFRKMRVCEYEVIGLCDRNHEVDHVYGGGVKLAPSNDVFEDDDDDDDYEDEDDGYYGCDCCGINGCEGECMEDEDEDEDEEDEDDDFGYGVNW